MGFAYFFRKIANLKDSAYFEMRYLVWTAMQLCNLMPYSCPNTSAAGAPRGPGPAPRETSRPTYPRRIRAARRREPGNQGRGGGGGNPIGPRGPPENPPGPERAGRPTRRTATARTERTAKTPAGEVHRTQGDKIWKGMVWWKGTELNFCVSFSEIF